MALGAHLRRLGMRPRVVQRRAGRVRVHFRLMRDLPEQHQDFARQVLALVCLPAPVASAEPDFRAGDLLIHYDATRAAESTVLAYLRSLMRLLDREWDPLTAVPMAHLPDVLARFSRVLEQAVARASTLPNNLHIPDDVWAWPT